MGLATQVLDYYDDVDRRYLTKVAMAPTALHGVPMHDLSPVEHASLQDSNFGLVVLTKKANILRRFPVNDPGNSWLSSQYFQETHEKLAFPARFIAAKFIKAACDAYAVPASRAVEAYAEKASEDSGITSNLYEEGSAGSWMLRKMAQSETLSKQASEAEIHGRNSLPDEHFAIVVKSPDGSVMRKYAMPDADHVSKAASYFDKYAMQMEPRYRHQFAASVQRRASELDVDISNHVGVNKWASAGWNANVEYHLEQRKSLLPRNIDAHAALDKLAAQAGSANPMAAAEALETFDQVTGLDKYYDRGLSDPYSSVMGKKASAWSADIDGVILTEQHLEKAAASGKLGRYLGESFASQFRKNASAIFDSLPSPQKVLIKQIAFGEA